MESRNKKHPKLVGKDYYTQEQLAEIIQYAAQRNIEVIPELDIPGHTVAILAAYPELGCTHTDTLPKIVGKTTDLMLCANNEKVYSVYQDIIKEISSLFPSDYIHLGGDEAVIEKNWTQCSRCQAMMKKLGYQKASQLMIPFSAVCFLSSKRTIRLLYFGANWTIFIRLPTTISFLIPRT